LTFSQKKQSEKVIRRTLPVFEMKTRGVKTGRTGARKMPRDFPSFKNLESLERCPRFVSSRLFLRKPEVYVAAAGLLTRFSSGAFPRVKVIMSLKSLRSHLLVWRKMTSMTIMTPITSKTQWLVAQNF